MAKSSRQTFKKRQRESAKKQKKEDKSKRLAARRGDLPPEEEPKEVISDPDETDDGLPKLKITLVGGSSTKSDK